MNVLLEELPALGLGSVSTLLEVTFASVIKASTSCILEANTNVTVMNLRLLLCVVPSYGVEKSLNCVLMMGVPGAGEDTGIQQTEVQFNH